VCVCAYLHVHAYMWACMCLVAGYDDACRRGGCVYVCMHTHTGIVYDGGAYRGGMWVAVLFTESALLQAL